MFSRFLLLLTVVCLLGFQGVALAQNSMLKAMSALVPYGGFHPLASKTIYLPQQSLTGASKGLSVLTARPARTWFAWLPAPVLKNKAPQPVDSLLTGWSAVDVSSLSKPAPYAMGYFASSYALKPFSALDKPMLDRSLVQFQVDDGVFWKQLRSSLSAITFHRSGQSVGSKASGLTLYAGHLNDAEPSPEARMLGNQVHSALNLVGGWYEGEHENAYTKRLETQALVASQLMGLYQQNPKRMEQLDIPFQPMQRGANMALPPLLREIQFGLQWLNAAQTPEGRFLSQVHGLKPVDAYQPASSDTQTRYYEPPELDASLMAIGTLAKAARVFGKEDTAYAVASLRAAEKGWQALWLDASAKNVTFFPSSEENELLQAFPLPLSSLTLPQQEALFFASAELWLATHKEVYATLMSKSFHLFSASLLEWKRDLSPVVQATLMAYLTEDSTEEVLKPEMLLAFRELLNNKAQHYFALGTTNPWHLPVEREENLNLPQLAQRAQLLLDWGRLEPTSKSAASEAAWAVYRFIMGQNPWGKAFVTASNELVAAVKKTPELKTGETTIPTNTADLFRPLQAASITYPCHPLSQAAGRPVGGLLLFGLGTASLWENPVPKVVDSDSLCVQNKATLRSALQLALLAGSLNEAFNAEATTVSSEDAATTRRGFRLPTIPKK
jgi:hypothetical protein